MTRFSQSIFNPLINVEAVSRSGVEVYMYIEVLLYVFSDRHLCVAASKIFCDCNETPHSLIRIPS